MFFANAERSLAEAIEEVKPETVEELHVSAPFFDEEARALRGLIQRTKPARGVRIYLGARPSVKGEARAAMLSELETPVSVFRYSPDRFVHAKLIVIVGHGAEAVQDTLGTRVEYAVQEEQLGTGRAVHMAEVELAGKSGETIVVCGDTALLTSEK